jgi:hypothetical protein
MRQAKKSEGKRPFERPRHRWDDIKIDLKELWYENVDSIELVLERDQ